MCWICYALVYLTGSLGQGHTNSNVHASSLKGKTSWNKVNPFIMQHELLHGLTIKAQLAYGMHNMHYNTHAILAHGPPGMFIVICNIYDIVM